MIWGGRFLEKNIGMCEEEETIGIKIKNGMGSQNQPRAHTHFRRPETEKLWEMETVQTKEAITKLQSVGLETPS